MVILRRHSGYLFCVLWIVFSFPVGIGALEPDPGFTRQEIEWLRSHPEIRIVVNDGPPPVSFWSDISDTPPGDISRPFPPPPGPPGNFDPDRVGTDRPLIRANDQELYKFRGVAADYLKEVEAITGIRFKTVLYSDHNFKGSTEALIKGEVDLMPSVIADKKAREHLYLTEPYVRIPVVFVMQPDKPYLNDIQKLRSMNVAGVFSIRPKVENLGLKLKIHNVSPAEGLMGVATGKFDVFICELSLVSSQLAKTPVTNIKISGELPVQSQFTMSVGPHIKEFLPILNKALAAIPAEQKEKIWKKWFRINYEKKLISSPWIWIVGSVGFVLIIAGIAGAFYFYRRFDRIKTAVDALDPHLLSVNIDHNILITEVTEALCQATGFNSDDLVGKPLMALGSPLENSPNSMKHVWETLETGNSWKGDIRILKKDGSALWTEAVVSPMRRKNDDNDGYTIIYQDVTSRKHFENLASHDELTGLYNRRHFNNTVPALLKTAHDDKQVFSLLLLDVDNFKKYNDTYGHPAGDKVLAAIGRELKAAFQRNNDMVFRLGGEEFGASIVVSASADALAIARKILKRIRDLGIEHEHNPPGVVTVSIGVKSVGAGEKYDLKTVYEKADRALYNAKESGRNKIVEDT